MGQAFVTGPESVPKVVTGSVSDIHLCTQHGWCTLMEFLLAQCPVSPSSLTMEPNLCWHTMLISM
jgi:hypothetical protein